MTSPHTLLPTDLQPGAEVALIDDPLSGDLCNLFDGCYELMMQVLGRAGVLLFLLALLPQSALRST